MVAGKTILAAPSSESHCAVTKGKLRVKREIIMHRDILFGPAARDASGNQAADENVHEGKIGSL